MLDTMDSETQEYIDSSREFMRRARSYLDAGDLHQASGKGWGAASHMALAVSRARGWKYTTHRDIYDIVDRMVDLLGRDDILAWQASATQLHDFFYARKGQLHPRSIKFNLDRVESMLDDIKTLVE